MKIQLIRSFSFNLFLEISVRILLISTFCYLETLTPYQRVIHQADLETIYKYPRHDSFVSGTALWVIVLSVPFLLSILAWGVCNDCNDALEILLAWSLSVGFTGCLTNTIKLIAGRPRPDYFFRCYPDGVIPDDGTCTGDPGAVLDGRKSFPSGHSSLSFSSLAICSLWLFGRLEAVSRRRDGCRVLVSAAPLVGALCVALSRTCDYHHHWEDVLVGSSIGFCIARFCYRQYYNPVTSDLAGVPYVVTSVHIARHSNGKLETSPLKEPADEGAPLLAVKNDKWI